MAVVEESAGCWTSSCFNALQSQSQSQSQSYDGAGDGTGLCGTWVGVCDARESACASGFDFCCDSVLTWSVAGNGDGDVDVSESESLSSSVTLGDSLAAVIGVEVRRHGDPDGYA